MDVQYIKAEEKDADVLLKIYNDSFYEDYVQFGVCPGYGRSLDQMKESIRSHPKFIINCDKKPVGVISVQKQDSGIYYLGCLCVIPKYQRKGIGYHAISYLDVLYLDWRTVTLDVPSDKTKSVSFYQNKCGFEKIGERTQDKVALWILKKNRDCSWERQLEHVAKSYNRGVEFGKQGIDLYQSLPMSITSEKNYALFEEMQKNGTYCDSDRSEIIEFLNPKKGMRMVDLGCCLNFMFRGYDQWKSLYYGVDISKDTIELLKWFVWKNKLLVGDFYCGSMHETPYEDNFFDIGACIGSLEYFEEDFVKLALKEFRRIMKCGGRFVLDIPNVGHPLSEMCFQVEAYLGRADLFQLKKEEFDELLEPYFQIEKVEEVAGMLEYFLIVV